MATLAETMALLKGAKNKYSRGIGKTIKLKEGKTKIRILRGEAKFWRDLGVHWIKPDEKAKPVAVIGCHDHTYDQPCPVCTAIDKAKKSATDDDTLKLYDSWKARREVLLNALVLDGPDASPDPQVLSLTPTTFGNLISLIETYADADQDALDLANGIDFIFERRGKGFDTEYQVMAAPISKPVAKSVLTKLVNLDEFIEKEFFRGDETKGLNAIASISGIALALPAPSRSAGLLTGKPALDTEVEEAVVAEIEAAAPAAPAPKAPVEKAAAPKAATKTADAFNADLPADELDGILADLDDL